MSCGYLVVLVYLCQTILNLAKNPFGSHVFDMSLTWLHNDDWNKSNAETAFPPQFLTFSGLCHYFWTWALVPQLPLWLFIWENGVWEGWAFPLWCTALCRFALLHLEPTKTTSKYMLISSLHPHCDCTMFSTLVPPLGNFFFCAADNLLLHGLEAARVSVA